MSSVSCRYRRKRVGLRSSANYTVDYKGHRLEAQSYQDIATGRWVPRVTITWRNGADAGGHALTAFDHGHDSRARRTATRWSRANSGSTRTR
jgi:hypothetical protein